jgi:hypothetical protein
MARVNGHLHQLQAAAPDEDCKYKRILAEAPFVAILYD